MSRVLITGSADGLGRLAAESLSEEGHEVVLHARSQKRLDEARAAVPKAKSGVVGDLTDLDQVRSVAEQANKVGDFDAVIHNAGIYRGSGIFEVNTLAPYALTALIRRPKRLIYLTSGLHMGGAPEGKGYGDSKLHDVMFAFAAARLWPDVYSNAVDPGWVPTKMGGPGAPDDLEEGWRSQAWLAVSDDKAAKVSGKLFFHRKPRTANPAATDTALQDRLLEKCRRLTGIRWD